MRKAVDTCVIARVITQDDPVQSPLAVEALRTPCYLTLTVILESVWLLASRYKMDRPTIVASLNDIIDAPSMKCEQQSLVYWALDRYLAGASIGDMIHLVSAQHQDAMLTFDGAMKTDAGSDSPIPVELLTT